APSGSTLGRYLLLGIEHILTGWDHLAFVIALLLLAGTLGEVARLVTGFTIAHSVTLALAVLGLVHPEAQAVEAVIGFSVALVGVENGWVLAGRGRALPWIVTAGLSLATLLAVAGAGTLSAMTLAGLTIFTASHFALLSRAERPARWRAVLAFAFGLVHGFGFAGVLSEMTLPTARLAPALFGFNLGVEIGQLGVVLLVWPLLQVLARRRGDRARRLTAEFASAAIFCIGLVWFLTRAF
ncbi:MAG: HupE/UreJ family protein, partial [Proteobacteria bacterium]|nr:HupE/UreJ family protein [Pseudomonadota bacterium]